MAIKPVTRMGAAVLRETAAPVTQFGSDDLLAIVQDLKDTMAAENGAGIAAPQIGVGIQLVIFGGFKSSRYPDAEDIPFTVLCNPTVTPLDNDIEEAWEGCLSVPGMRGLVPRHASVRYQGFDEFGQVIDRTVAGFHARVVQHECDHLFGMLYPMRVRDLRNFGYEQELFPLR
ncbi:peptide deformylase [Burkholderiaceae bacterium DAT-1]|nr:peptide deformylase [Burkholderiaceae bacterium DAT-1]